MAFLEVSHAPYMVRARGARCVISGSAWHLETKGFLTSNTTAHALASVYNRSFNSIYLNCKRVVLMALIGYARVSTEDQTPLPQADELRAAGCRDIHEEQASGASRSRPILARVLDRISTGDVLLVVRIDRLAR